MPEWNKRFGPARIHHEGNCNAATRVRLSWQLGDKGISTAKKWSIGMVSRQGALRSWLLNTKRYGIGLFAFFTWLCPPVCAQPVEIERLSTPSVEGIVFGNESLNEAKRQLKRTLDSQINQLDIRCQLSTAQKHKLELAGQGDISRFFQEFEVFKSDFSEGRIDIKLSSLSLKARPMRLRYTSGLHLTGSLFRRSIPNTLSGDQLATFSRWLEETMNRRRKTAVDQVTRIVTINCGLGKEDSLQLNATLLKEIPLAQLDGNFYLVYAFIQAAKLAEKRPELIPEKKVRQAIATEASLFQSMETMIRAAGYFPSEDE